LKKIIFSTGKKQNGNINFFVTDFPNNFKVISERFLGQKIKEVKKVKLQ